MSTNAAEIWVAGYPGFCGGAGTELDHNIDLWRSLNIGVNLVPMLGCDRVMSQLCQTRGCRTWGYEPAIFKDRIVVAFCNEEFLKRLPEIIEAGRPKSVIWFNCMTWTSEDELTAHRNGWIDLHGFVSDYQRQCLKPQLERIAPVNELIGYQPYFNPDNASQKIRFEYRAPGDHFALGRISRDDPAKFPADTWKTFADVRSPRAKKVFVLGYGPNARHTCGPPPPGLDVQIWPPNRIPVSQLYARLHCMIYQTDGFKDSYGRIVPEAYAAGVPVIVHDDYAFPELVQDGVTGFRCKSAEEMSARAGELASDENKRKTMIHAARDFLVEEIANAKKCWPAWEGVLSN